MTRKQILFIFLFIAFAILSSWATYRVGIAGIFAAGMNNPGGIQIFVDLIIACSVAWTFMWPDAKRRGINPMPYVIGTLALGSFGLLGYVIRRESSTDPASAST